MRCFLSCLVLATSLTAMAQGAPPADPAQPRTAYFVLDYLIKKSVHAGKLVVELQKTGQDLQEKLKAKGLEGQNLQQQLQSPGIKEEGREALQKQLRDLEYEFKKMKEDGQEKLDKVQSRVMGQLQSEVYPIVESLAKEQKLQIVLNYSGDGLMVYADEEWLLSFTGEVAKRFDAKYESAGGAEAPKAPGAPKTAAPKAPGKPAPKAGK